MNRFRSYSNRSRPYHHITFLLLLYIFVIFSMMMMFVPSNLNDLQINSFSLVSERNKSYCELIEMHMMAHSYSAFIIVRTYLVITTVISIMFARLFDPVVISI